MKHNMRLMFSAPLRGIKSCTNPASPEQTKSFYFFPPVALSLKAGNSTSVCLLKKEGVGGRGGVELYILLMEGDTVGALGINLDARMES